MIKGIIYDMDDVMIDSYPLHVKATGQVLNDFGYTLEEIPQKIRASFMGRRIQEIMKEIAEYLKIKEEKILIDKRRDVFLGLVKEKLTTLPGLTKSLDLLKRENFKIALGSSGIKSYIDFVLDKFNLRNYFDEIVAGDQVKKGKPDPEVYQLCSLKLGFKTTECVVFEDANTGIEAAKSAGCKCIAIVNHHTLPQDLSRADLKINSLAEVNLEMIKSLNN